MTIKLSQNDLRLKPGEVPTPERLAQLFEAIQTNFEQLAQLFPLGSKYLVNESVTNEKLARPEIAGQVSSAGAVVKGEGFTSERTATGKYTIKLSKELPSVGTLVGSSLAIAVVVPVNEGKAEFKVESFAVEGGSPLVNAAFNFYIKAS